MECNYVYTKFLLVLVLGTAVLAACISANAPTSEAPLTEVVTVSVERPSATATPQPSNTSNPILLETAVGSQIPRASTLISGAQNYGSLWWKLIHSSLLPTQTTTSFCRFKQKMAGHPARAGKVQSQTGPRPKRCPAPGLALDWPGPRHQTAPQSS